ncbi:hypothetical protein J1614_003870 [Plenodomus biglobosus]|nr:hypothetical protein J1614_003870 [Plenodomus biglobosus]
METWHVSSYDGMRSGYACGKELAHAVNDEGTNAGSLEPGIDLVVVRLSIEQRGVETAYCCDGQRYTCEEGQQEHL